MSQEDTNTRLYSLPEAARELAGISMWSLRKHIYRGNICTIRLGRRIAIPSQEIIRIKSHGLPSLVSSNALGSQGKPPVDDDMLGIPLRTIAPDKQPTADAKR